MLQVYRLQFTPISLFETSFWAPISQRQRPLGTAAIARGDGGVSCHILVLGLGTGGKGAGKLE